MTLVSRLIKLKHDGLTYLGCVLEIDTVGFVKLMDFKAMFDRLGFM